MLRLSRDDAASLVLTTLPLTAAYLLMNFSMLLWYSLFGKYLVVDLGFSGDELGTVIMLYNMFYAISALPSGKISDLVDIRKVLATGAAVYAMGILMMSLTRSFWLLAMACAVTGLGEGIFFTSGTVYSVRRGGVSRVGLTYGIVFSSGLLGQVLGALTSGYVKEYFGAKAMFAASSLLAASALPLVLFLRDFQAPSRSRRSSIGLVELLREHRGFRILAIGLIFHSLGYNMIAPFFSVHAGEIGLADKEIGVVNFTWLLSMMLTAFFWSMLADRIKSKLILASHIALSSLVWISYAYSKNYVMLVQSAVALGLVGAMDMPARRKLVAELESGEGLGTMIGSLDLITMTFSIPASIIGGVLYEWTNIPILFLAASLVNFIGVPLVFEVGDRVRGSSSVD